VPITSSFTKEITTDDKITTLWSSREKMQIVKIKNRQTSKNDEVTLRFGLREVICVMIKDGYQVSSIINKNIFHAYFLVDRNNYLTARISTAKLTKYKIPECLPEKIRLEVLSNTLRQGEGVRTRTLEWTQKNIWDSLSGKSRSEIIENPMYCLDGDKIIDWVLQNASDKT
jgi:hypothetical protein